MTERARRHSRTLALTGWILAGGALVGLVGGLSFCAALRCGGRVGVVTVPDFVGVPRSEASKRAAAQGLILEIVDERHDPNVPSGAILSQVPAPGAEVKVGRRVRAALSRGGETHRVPHVVGQAARRVELELRRDGLVPADEARAHVPAVPEGTILAQVPPPGAASLPGTRVYRLVSAGPRPPRFVMPDLAGRPLETVEGWLQRSGFRRGSVRRVASPERPPGTVVGQLPLPGYPIRARDVVELTVAE